MERNFSCFLARTFYKVVFFFQIIQTMIYNRIRSSPPEVFLGNVNLKICSKFTGEHPSRSVILIDCTEIALRYRSSLSNSLYIFRTYFYKNIYGGLLLQKIKVNIATFYLSIFREDYNLPKTRA